MSRASDSTEGGSSGEDRIPGVQGDAPLGLASLTGGRLLARNTIFNLLGQGAPMLVALVSIPLLIRGLGEERFGVLTLAWIAIGYFSFFDLGVGRAITHLVAEKVGSEREDEVPVIVWTALLLMALLGCAGGVVVALIAPWLVTILKVSGPLAGETQRAFYLIAICLPWVVSTAGLRGVLEAKQRFDLVNLVRVPMGVFTFLGPLAVLPVSRSVSAVVFVLMIGRIIAWGVHLVLCLKAVPLLRRHVGVSREAVAPLLRFGSWLTVSNIVSPIMDGLDRFLVGALLSVTAVTYYVTPYEVVTKLWIITASILGVLFPAFAASFARDRERTSLLFDRGVRYVMLSVYPVVLILVTLAGEVLTFWLDWTAPSLSADFARNSAGPLQWLAIGIFMNMIGQVAYTLIQGVGRPDITGKLHLLELPLYLGAMWWLVPRFGVEGAAMAWAARAGLDASILLAIAGRFLPGGGQIVRRTGGLMVAGVVVLIASATLGGIVPKMIFLVTGLVFFVVLGWKRLLTGQERGFLLALRSRGATG